MSPSEFALIVDLVAGLWPSYKFYAERQQIVHDRLRGFGFAAIEAELRRSCGEDMDSYRPMWDRIRSALQRQRSEELAETRTDEQVFLRALRAQCRRDGMDVTLMPDEQLYAEWQASEQRYRNQTLLCAHIQEWGRLHDGSDKRDRHWTDDYRQRWVVAYMRRSDGWRGLYPGIDDMDDSEVWRAFWAHESVDDVRRLFGAFQRLQHKAFAECDGYAIATQMEGAR